MGIKPIIWMIGMVAFQSVPMITGESYENEVYPPKIDYRRAPFQPAEEEHFTPCIRFWSRKQIENSTYDAEPIRDFIENSQHRVLIKGENTYETIFYIPLRGQPIPNANICTIDVDSHKLRTMDWKPFNGNSKDEQTVHFICDGACCKYFCCAINQPNLTIFIVGALFVIFPFPILACLWACKRYTPSAYFKVFGPDLKGEDFHRRYDEWPYIAKTKHYTHQVHPSDKPLGLNVLH